MHNTKVSLDLASDEVTRIAVRSAFLEFATGDAGAAGATDSGEVVSKPAPQTPPPTHAGGQDDGSYTNSLKLGIRVIEQTSLFTATPVCGDLCCPCVR